MIKAKENYFYFIRWLWRIQKSGFMRMEAQSVWVFFFYLFIARVLRIRWLEFTCDGQSVFVHLVCSGIVLLPHHKPHLFGFHFVFTIILFLKNIHMIILLFWIRDKQKAILTTPTTNCWKNDCRSTKLVYVLMIRHLKGAHCCN